VSKLEERSQQLSILRGQVERGAPQGQAGGNITFWGCMVVGLILFESLSWKEAGSTCSKYHVNVSEMPVKFGDSAYAGLALVRRFLRWEATAIPIFVEGHASS